MRCWYRRHCALAWRLLLLPSEGEAVPVEQPVLPERARGGGGTVTDETSGALTPEGNLTLVMITTTNYSDGSGQQFITPASVGCDFLSGD